jgi:hypothetical protein
LSIGQEWIKWENGVYSLVGGQCLDDGWCNLGPSTSIGRSLVSCSLSMAAIPESVSGALGISPCIYVVVMSTGIIGILERTYWNVEI